MRKLIAWNLVTLDGCFEGPEPWSIDWHEQVWGEELEAFSLEQGRDAVAEVAGFKRESGGNLYVFGSAELGDTLLRARLFDEIRLGLVPLVLGNGRPLFKPDEIRIPMRLLEARPLHSGCVILRYRPEPTATMSGAST